MAAAWIAFGSTAAFLALHLWADTRGAAAPRAIGKLLASSAFVLLALALGVEGPFARAVLAGLVLSAAGDALLLSARRAAFLGGLAAFLLAHVAYAFAFALRSRPSAWAGLLVLSATAAALRWLWRRLGSMRAPVVAYCAAIGAMLWFALGTDRPEVRAGALLFYLSDLLVARDRFVHPGFTNRLLGLPVYYAGQLLIALSVR